MQPLNINELYELKACVNMAYSELEEGEYKAFLQSIEEKLNAMFEHSKGKK